MAGGSGLGCLVMSSSSWGCSCLKEGPLAGDIHTWHSRQEASVPPGQGLSTELSVLTSWWLPPHRTATQESKAAARMTRPQPLHPVISTRSVVTQLGPFQCSRGPCQDVNRGGGDHWGQVCDSGGWVLCYQGAAEPSPVTRVHLFSQVGLRVVSAQGDPMQLSCKSHPACSLYSEELGPSLTLSKPCGSPDTLPAF